MVWCGVVWCGVVWCGVVWCGVVWCGVVWGRVAWGGVVWGTVGWGGAGWCGDVGYGVVWCGVVRCGVVWGGVPKALLPEGNGREVYPRVQVNGRAVCLSARCVLVCCCTAGTCALSHLAGAVLPTPVHGLTGSSGRVLCRTFSTLCAGPYRLVLCSTLHCVCLAALHLWAVGYGHWAVALLLWSATVLGGNGQRNSRHALPHCLWAVGNTAPTLHRHTAGGQRAVKILQRTA